MSTDSQTNLPPVYGYWFAHVFTYAKLWSHTLKWPSPKRDSRVVANVYGGCACSGKETKQKQIKPPSFADSPLGRSPTFQTHRLLSTAMSRRRSQRAVTVSSRQLQFTSSLNFHSILPRLRTDRWLFVRFIKLEWPSPKRDSRVVANVYGGCACSGKETKQKQIKPPSFADSPLGRSPTFQTHRLLSTAMSRRRSQRAVTVGSRKLQFTSSINFHSIVSCLRTDRWLFVRFIKLEWPSPKRHSRVVANVYGGCACSGKKNKTKKKKIKTPSFVDSTFGRLPTF